MSLAETLCKVVSAQLAAIPAASPLWCGAPPTVEGRWLILADTGSGGQQLALHEGTCLLLDVVSGSLLTRAWNVSRPSVREKDPKSGKVLKAKRRAKSRDNQRVIGTQRFHPPAWWRELHDSPAGSGVYLSRLLALALDERLTVAVNRALRLALVQYERARANQRCAYPLATLEVVGRGRPMLTAAPQLLRDVFDLNSLPTWDTE